MLEIFQYSFMQRAFLAGVLVAIIAPLIGTFLVTRRLSSIADTLSHVALTGVAVGLLLGVQPLITTIVVTVLTGLVLERLRNNGKLSGEALLAMFLPGGLALAVVLISISGVGNLNLVSYLFGSISTVQTEELVLIFALSMITIGIVGFNYRRLLYAAFDPEAAQLNGINVTGINFLLIVLTAITISMTMRIVGILLVGALMVIPVVTATQIARSFKQVLLFGVGFALVAIIFGLNVAYFLNLPAGGATVLVSLGLFVITLIFKK